MGSIDQITHRVRNLDMKDVSELCILGLLYDDMRTENGIVAAVRQLDLGTWQPVREVIEATLERLIASKCITLLETAGEVYFSVTGTGNKRFFALIRRPLPFDLQVRANSVALKTYFVETTPLPVRRCVVDELVGYYNCQLCALQEGCDLCPLNSSRQSVFIDQKRNGISHEISWLKGLC